MLQGCVSVCYSASVKLPGSHIPPSVQSTAGTKQTLSEDCNPTFRRFLALGNRIAHSTEEGEGWSRKKKERRKRSPIACSSALLFWLASQLTDINVSCVTGYFYCTLFLLQSHLALLFSIPWLSQLPVHHRTPFPKEHYIKGNQKQSFRTLNWQMMMLCSIPP